MKSDQTLLLTIAVILLLAIQLTSPLTVHADEGTPPPTENGSGETPPPADESSEVTPPPDETSGTETVDSVDEAPTEESGDSASSEPTDAPTEPVDSVPQESQEPPDEIATDVPDEPTEPDSVPGEPAVEEGDEEVDEPPLAEILAELPEGTDIVVLDENGQPEPLVTRKAAEIIMESDPMWCPVSAKTVTSDCVYASTLSDVPDPWSAGFPPTPGLLTLLKDQNKNEPGTIYFTSAYSRDDVTFDGTDLTDLADHSLTLQGGWDGNNTNGSVISYSGQSIFSVPITITNWNNTITVNNITVNTNTAGTGLKIDTTKDVNLNKSTFKKNNDGVNIKAANVSIANSTFEDNVWDGAYIVATETVNISDSDFIGNGAEEGDGASISADRVTISNSSFLVNSIDGAHLRANQVTISNSTFSGNGDSGASLWSADKVDISKSTFSENNTGVLVYSSDSSIATIKDSLFKDNNTGVYAWAYVSDSAGIPSGKIDLTLDCVQFENNSEDIYKEGDVTLKNVLCEEPPPPRHHRHHAWIVTLRRPRRHVQIAFMFHRVWM